MTKTGYVQSVAAYVRVSTQEQKLHGLSLDAQKEKLTELANNINKENSQEEKRIFSKRILYNSSISSSEASTFANFKFSFIVISNIYGN